MASVAQSYITLVSVSDAYNVSLQPPNVVIRADAEGNHPILNDAHCTISLYRGDTKLRISRCELLNSSVVGSLQDCVLERTGDDFKLSVTAIDGDGWREIGVYTDTDELIRARFSYTVVKESGLLNWVKAWNGEYTQITGDSVATPNIYIGSKDSLNLLSGIYVGASMPNHSSGIYGFKSLPQASFQSGDINSYELFSLNENGGKIGGWEILNNGITSSNGNLQILSSGSIVSKHNDEPIWEIKSDGYASFGKGRAVFHANGAKILDWSFSDKNLVSEHFALMSGSQSAGLWLTPGSLSRNAYSQWGAELQLSGGIMLETFGSETTLLGVGKNGNGFFQFCTDGNNRIGSWSFNGSSIYLNEECDCVGSFASEYSMTLGAEGIRGPKWRLEADGSGALAGGNIEWDNTGNVVFSNNIKLAWSNITETESLTNKLTKIDANGIYTGEISADMITSGTINAEGDVKVKGDITVRKLLHNISNRGNVVTSAFWCSSLMGAFNGETPMANGNILKFPRLRSGEAMETTVVHIATKAYREFYGDPELLCMGINAIYSKSGSTIQYDPDPAIMFMPNYSATPIMATANGALEGITGGIDVVRPGIDGIERPGGVTEGGSIGTVVRPGDGEVLPGSDPMVTVTDKFYGEVDLRDSIGITGVWKFYGVGLDLLVGSDDDGNEYKYEDGTPLNVTYWIAVQVK